LSSSAGEIRKSRWASLRPSEHGAGPVGSELLEVGRAIANPQRRHELEAAQPFQVLGVPPFNGKTCQSGAPPIGFMFDLKLQAISAYFDPPRHQDRALLRRRVMALFSAFPRTLGAGTYVFWNAAFGWEPIFRRSAALLPVSSVDATAR
jgi:hypothetical protein